MNGILTNWKILPSPSEKNLPLRLVLIIGDCVHNDHFASVYRLQVILYMAMIKYWYLWICFKFKNTIVMKSDSKIKIFRNNLEKQNCVESKGCVNHELNCSVYKSPQNFFKSTGVYRERECLSCTLVKKSFSILIPLHLKTFIQNYIT